MENKVLITGGLGFMGQHLARHLLRADPSCRLTIVDNLSSSKINYAWLQNRAEIMIADFRTVSLASRTFTHIYHLASPVGSLGILTRSGYVAKEISDLALRAGELAANNGAALLYVSSSEVYGKAGVQREDDELTVPVQTGTRMEYSLGKLAGEHLLRNLAARFGFRLTVVRPFNALGEGQSARIGFVVPTFFQNALAGKPLPLFNGGNQIRCFCHAEDVARGLVAIQEHGKDRHTYNLGNPDNAVTIRDLALRIRDLCASDSKLETVDPTQRFGVHYLEASAKSPCIDKIKTHTGWTPAIDLDNALTRVHQYYSSTMRKGNSCTPFVLGRSDLGSAVETTPST
jgi:nucleoside-diphosphate-sugar epimerase